MSASCDVRRRLKRLSPSVTPFVAKAKANENLVADSHSFSEVRYGVAAFSNPCVPTTVDWLQTPGKPKLWCSTHTVEISAHTDC